MYSRKMEKQQGGHLGVVLQKFAYQHSLKTKEIKVSVDRNP